MRPFFGSKAKAYISLSAYLFSSLFISIIEGESSSNAFI